MPVQIAIKSLFRRFWHVLDNFWPMTLLPLAHRRDILTGVLLVVIGLLLPDGPAPPMSRTTHEAKLTVSPPDTPLPTDGHRDSPRQQPDAALPDSEEETTHAAASSSPDRASPTVASHNEWVITGGIEQQWRSYRLGPDKTLSQLFRDNGLPPADVYAMTQVEGSEKPLSHLQSGQVVKIRQNASGVVTGLAIAGSRGDILFTRQADGGFTRVQ